MIKLKLVNETDWQSADLRKLFNYCLYEWRHCLEDWQKRGMVIVVKNSIRFKSRATRMEKVDGKWIEVKRTFREARYYGNAHIKGTRINLFIPCPENSKDGKLDIITLGWITMHEMTHIIGQRHKDIKGSIWSNWHWDDDHAVMEPFKQFTVSRKEVKEPVPNEKAAGELQSLRYERAKTNLTRNVLRLHRYQTLVKKWKKKIKYYEKSLAIPAGERFTKK